jgi:hypothetical protein
MKSLGGAVHCASWLVCCSGVSGCASGYAPDGLGQELEPMVRADPSPSGSEDAVVLLRATANGEQICTGTLVAPNLVLTSRHCVARLNPGEFRCDARGELAENPSGGGTLGADLPANEIEIHGTATPRVDALARGERIVSSLSTNVCKNDIAFVALDRHLELPVAPVRIRTPTARYELATLVGYGADGTSAEYRWLEAPRQRLGRQPVLEVGPDSIDDGVIILRPRILVFGGPATCHGDSGGPALSERTGAVIGVLSVMDGLDCLADEVELHYTHTTAFEALALEAYAAASAAPRFEDDRSLGELCSENYECASGRCFTTTEGDTVCADFCDDGQCPSGYACVSSGAEALCSRRPAEPCADCGTPPSPAAGGEGCSVGPGASRAGGSAAALALAALVGSRRRARSKARAKLGCAAALGLVALLGACGEDEVITGKDAVTAGRGGTSGVGGSGSGATGPGGSAGSGGDSSVTGGTAGRGGAVGSGGRGGAEGNAGGSNDGAPESGGNSGLCGAASTCDPADAAYMLTVCNRIPAAEQAGQMRAVALEYNVNMRDDCKSAGLADRQVPFEFLNQVLSWNFEFWGCRLTGVNDFGPAGSAQSLSAADVRLLSEHYLDAAKRRLS